MSRQERAIPLWKKLFDLLLSASLLLVVAIPIGLIALAVWFSIGRPVFFRQVRPGKGGVPFGLVKFRTMSDARDAAGELLPDADRLTPLGRFLRATSLDELPELWNILKGEMSFVGPRPLLPAYMPFYLEHQARRHEVVPGLTGLAQINGRNAQSWEDRFRYDVEYVDTLSFWTDMKILVKTALLVLRRDGVSAEGHETMPRFDEMVKAGTAKGRVPIHTPEGEH
ncbi:MAG: sugar transferase [Parvibaculum sp.]